MSGNAVEGGAMSYYAVVPCNEAQEALPSRMFLFQRRDQAEAIARSLQVQEPGHCWTIQRRALHFHISVYMGEGQQP